MRFRTAGFWIGGLVTLCPMVHATDEVGRGDRLVWASQMRVAVAYATKVNRPVILCRGGGWGFSSIHFDEPDSRARLARSLKAFVPALIADSADWVKITDQFHQPPTASMIFLTSKGTLMGRLIGNTSPSELDDSIDLLVGPKRTGIAERVRTVRRLAMSAHSSHVKKEIAKLSRMGISRADSCNLYASLGDSRRAERDYAGSACAYIRSAQYAITDSQRFRAYRRLFACYYRLDKGALATASLRSALSQRNVPDGDKMALHSVMVSMRGRGQ